MAVASGLPQLEEPAFQNSRAGRHATATPLGLLTGNQRRIAVDSAQISPVMKQAIIAIEDRRFYTNDGVDLRGIGRALWQDVRAKQTVQGGSTITQQFVKTALAAQEKRTLFNKMREAALAFQITRKWSKQRILRNYLNTIYFGNGAYGIESAARMYFGSEHPGCETQQGAPVRGAARGPGGRAAGRHRPVAERVRPAPAPEGRPSAGATSCSSACSSRATSAARSTTTAVAEPIPIRADVKPPRENTASTRTSPRGCASRSSTSSAAARSAPARRSRAASR